jgi:phosphohistidine phosphatase
VLWLVRHAEAADGLPDDERPLTERGMGQADAVGLALARLGTSIDACLSSPKVRAVQTAQRACEPLGVQVTVEPALSGEPIDVHELTAGMGNVMLVGHDPSLSLLLHDLTGTQVRLAKGSLAAVKGGELVALLRPSHLMVMARAPEQVAAG